MILEPAIINLTSNLDVICQQDGKGISSHEKLKVKALSCLSNLITNAPKSEYASLLKTNDSEILLGYLLSVLCRLAKDDKSKTIRLQALETIEALIIQLDRHHAEFGLSTDKCAMASIVSALPGVSSVLFKVIMSDAKLPKNLLIKSIQVLSKVISAALSPCYHDTIVTNNDPEPRLTGKNLIDTCDNLSIRMLFMLNYIMSNSLILHEDVKFETLNCCLDVLRNGPQALVSRSLKAIIRYMAFISSNLDKFTLLKSETQLKLMLMTDEIRFKISNCDHKQEQLDTVVLKCLFDLLDNLETNCFTMLSGERQSELEMLFGLLNLISSDSLTNLIETSSRKDQLLTVLINLTEFCTQQPLLFLTESRVNADAVQQINDNRIYTIEKRFTHLNEQEIVIVNDCCKTIGKTTDWPLLIDTIRCDLTQFSSPNNLYVTLQVIQGMLHREDLHLRIVSRFSSEMVQRYREEIGEQISTFTSDTDHFYSKDIMIIVVMIETVVTLVELHSKSINDSRQGIIILKDLICPLLNWCSSNNRAISEASLSAINQISLLFGHDSTKSFLEKNTDYIIDQAAKMLDSFPYNPEVTDVIAITFKLSSRETFCFFKDVYERVFKVLTKYHQTKKSIPLTLLLYRTVSILNDWRSASDISQDQAKPLSSRASIQTVISGLNIDNIICKLREKMDEVRCINESMKHMKSTKNDEMETVENIKSGQFESVSEDQAEIDDYTAPGVKDDDIVLTEKILKHCIGLISSSHQETKILALKTAAVGLNIIKDDENTLLPIVHQLWAPLLSRLHQNYIDHLEENLCAFECLVAMAVHAKDFIKRRTLETVIPRLCIFLESQWSNSVGKREFEPYCMTMVYKCQLRILSSLGQLAFHTQIAYTSLWRIIKVALKYLDSSQVPALRNAASNTLGFLIALDADCVWYFAKQSGKLDELDSLNLVLDLSRKV